MKLWTILDRTFVAGFGGFVKRGILLLIVPALLCSGGASLAAEPSSQIRALMIEAKQQERLLETGKAVEVYNKIIRISPREARYYAKRANLYSELNMYKEALKDFEASLRLTPAASVYRDRARTYWKMHKGKEAIADYDSALKLEPNNAGATRHRAHILRLEGRYQESVRGCLSALKLKTKAPHEVYLDLGQDYMKLGQYQKAVDCYTEMITISPDLSGGYYGRAAAYEKLGKNALANIDKKKGVEADGELDPNAVTGELRR